MPQARPMLGDVELQQVQQLEVEKDQVLTQHAVPALEGDFLQRQGRRATRVTVAGVLTGPAVADGLSALRKKFRAAEPVSFVADIATATRVDQVLIEEMGVRELAGKPERFEYSFTLREYIPPPPTKREEPPPPPPPPPSVETGTLVVEVTVQGQPDFDMGRLTVTVEGTQDDGTRLTRTLTNRQNNVWTEENFPPGQYTATATDSGSPAMSGSAEGAVRAGQTTRLQITLHPGVTNVIARAFIVHFRFDKAFVEPCMRQVLRRAVQYAAAHPAEKMLVVGHTDKTGSDTYNQSLSERRARAVYAHLTAGRDGAAARAEWGEIRKRATGALPSLNDNWGAYQYQAILQDLGFYTGSLSVTDTPESKAAIRAFQEDKGLAVDGIVGDQTWTALIDAYLAQDQDVMTVAESQLLPNAKDGCDGGPVKWLGCGEEDPVKNTEDAWRPNRRVEVLFVQADRLPCDVPKPVTFDLPAPGAGGSAWCLGSVSGPRACFLARGSAQPGKWLVQPAEPGQVTVRGSIRFADGTPAANMAYVLIAPDGEFMDGEVPRGVGSGEGIPGRTGADGSFAYPDRVKPVGIYSLEVRAPVGARLASDPPGTEKGPCVCGRLDGSAALDVVVSPAQPSDSRPKVQGTILDRFGEPRKNTAVEVVFGDGTRATPMSNDQGEFVVELNLPQEVGKIRYTLSDDEALDAAPFADFFVDVQSLQTDEGVRRRLHNLGFVIGDALDAAILAFQAAQGLDTTGAADDATRAKLGAIHDGTEPLLPDFELNEQPLSPDQLNGEGPPL